MLWSAICLNIEAGASLVLWVRIACAIEVIPQDPGNRLAPDRFAGIRKPQSCLSIFNDPDHLVTCSVELMLECNNVTAPQPNIHIHESNSGRSDIASLGIGSKCLAFADPHDAHDRSQGNPFFE